jgi:hypothetical protein
MDTNEKNPKKTPTYFCKNCNFYTCNKKDFARHNITDKHVSLTNPNLKTPKNPLYTCNCGKVYKHSSSLCAHKKKCNYEEKIENENIVPDAESLDKDQLILMLINQNAELIKETSEFKKMHPDCNTYHSKFSDQYNKIIVEAKLPLVESMGGSGDNDIEKEDKIIKILQKM